MKKEKLTHLKMIRGRNNSFYLKIQQGKIESSVNIAGILLKFFLISLKRRKEGFNTYLIHLTLFIHFFFYLFLDLERSLGILGVLGTHDGSNRHRSYPRDVYSILTAPKSLVFNTT